MSRSSDWPTLLGLQFMSLFLTIHFSLLSLHLFSLHTFILTPSLHSVSYLFFPARRLHHLDLLLFFFSGFTFFLFFYFITSPSALSEKLLELPPPEFWSAILWFKKARQTAFPINQYLHWLWLTPVTSALHDGKCSVLEQNREHLTNPGYSQNLAY